MRQEVVIESLDLSKLPVHRQLAVRITAAGVRQYQVAQKAGISETELSKVLAGRKALDDDLAATIAAAIAEFEAAA